MLKGRIVLVNFPFTDLSGYKLRPAVVLSSLKKGEDCLLAFISSAGIAKSEFDISLKPSAKNGLKINSVIKIDKIATLAKNIIIGELGVLEKEYLDQVDKKLRKLLSI